MYQYEGAGCPADPDIQRIFVRCWQTGVLHVYCYSCGGHWLPNLQEGDPWGDLLDGVDPLRASPVSRESIDADWAEGLIAPVGRYDGEGYDGEAGLLESDRRGTIADDYTVSEEVGRFQVLGPDGVAVSFSADDVERVLVDSRGRGPPQLDCWIAVELAASRVTFPLGAKGERAIAALFRSLPWFETREYHFRVEWDYKPGTEVVFDRSASP